MRWSEHLDAVLDGIDLELEPGAIASVTGHNGAGKTTLLRVIAGLLKPERGTTVLLGLDPDADRDAYKRRLGILPAGNSGLYARLNVDQNLDFWARLSLLPRRRRGSAVSEMLDLFGLHEMRGRRVDRLSMGQRQRLRLALTFLHDPDLVLLDEPSTSLDLDGTNLVREALRRLRERGGAALVCSPEAVDDRLGIDRAYVLHAGRLQEPVVPHP